MGGGWRGYIKKMHLWLCLHVFTLFGVVLLPKAITKCWCFTLQCSQCVWPSPAMVAELSLPGSYGFVATETRVNKAMCGHSSPSRRSCSATRQGKTRVLSARKFLCQEHGINHRRVRHARMQFKKDGKRKQAGPESFERQANGWSHVERARVVFACRVRVKEECAFLSGGDASRKKLFGGASRTLRSDSCAAAREK